MVRMLLALVTQLKWPIYQLDVKSAFLNGELEEEVYVAQLDGFVINGEEEKVYKLKKALYGLKQVPRAWYNKINSYFLQNGFERSENEHTLYLKKRGSLDDRKNTSGHVFSLGSGAITGSSKKQATMALSSSEAEYVVATSSSCQCIWLRRILADLHQKQEKATEIFCDNKSTIAMTKNPAFHGRTKHIDICFHFIHELVAKGEIILNTD
ncbi:hypothetical protein ACH5RR_000791 [Cinchona calisaya]|uniref:Reverse transcriptase Ty1/copia-type domain-containing protein n=1 Tax=Cinchona calisaya TaxID=153742 RepID=A0ABD3B251_9GENT